jgi:succinate dehydrogenase / fumarate reductase, cytochrome b subunit
MSSASALTSSTIGKKVLMAASGVVLFGFVVVHMLGNAQVFLPDGFRRLTDYGHLLRVVPELLWLARIVLLLSVIVHIVTAVQLTRIRRAARPIPYHARATVQATYASRTMMWSGPLLAAFLVFHLMNLTWGMVHPNYIEGDAGHNFRVAFQSVPTSLFYIVSMLALAFHLSHGAWSMFQSLGINHPKYNKLLRGFARYATFIVVAVNILMPLSVMTGLLK